MKETKEMYPSWGDDHGVRLGNVKIKDLHDFKEHPFQVVEDSALFELARSIEDKGVLVPLIIRANPYGEGYEIIAGHRRKAACKWAEISEVPAMIVELDDNEAVIAMVDSNLQREHIKPGEKAFAYKMKLEATKQQGRRTDLTSCQVGKKSVENPTLSLAKIGCGYDENGRWQVMNEEIEQTPIDSNKQLAMQLGESQRQIARYIRLTNLIPKILNMVDEGKIAFTVAVEQRWLRCLESTIRTEPPLINDICANAKGYEYSCYMMLRQKNRKQVIEWLLRIIISDSMRKKRQNDRRGKSFTQGK